jgi:subtilisin family serine protease
MHSPRRSRRLLSLLLVVLTALVGSASALAQGGVKGFTATPLSPSDQYSMTTAKDTANRPAAALGANSSSGKLVSVIVKLNSASLAAYTGDVPGLAATNPRVTGADKLDVTSSASKQYLAYVDTQLDSFAAGTKRVIPNVKVTQKLDIVVGGVVMLVPEDQVATLSKLPGVAAVYPDGLLQLEIARPAPQLHTSVDPGARFIGAPTIWDKLGGQESAGEGVIVGVLDTGVWPEHPSYSDPDPSGKPYSMPPPAPVGSRACEFSGGANPGPAFACNNKLIGADRFMATYDALVGLIPGEFTTARDDNGHGTHTSSTAAGNAGVAASIFGVPRGNVSGIAPRAHVIMYKVCGDQGCFSSDSAAAVQEAINDGVNVINFSISGGNNPYADAVELAFLDAYNAGIFVAASAGNSGPTPETVAHRGPWVTTVAASTLDRSFNNVVSVNGGALTLNGTSITGGISTPTPIVDAGAAPTNDPLCLSSTADGAFTGKIVVCKRGTNGRVEKGFNVKQRGAVGMVLYNNAVNVTDQETDNHFLPTSHIQFADGQTLLTFMTANPGATATLTAGVASPAQGDVMASFSSRGGPGQTLGVSKPDITAPGVQILAGHTPASVDLATGPTGELFQAIAGTSMSSPHIAGSGALIKALHPTWTPGQIKSALMTTAKTFNVVKEDGSTPANAFDDGSGRVNLKVAGDPGLTFDVTGADYLAHQNDLWSVNYPSLYHPSMPGIITVQRTAHSTLGADTTWKLEVKRPADKDFKITVPATIAVAAGGNTTFDITVDARDVPLGGTRFATLKLTQTTSPKRELHIPITFVRGQAPVALTKSCAPAVFPKNSNTSCTITITNGLFSDSNVNLTDNLPSRLQLLPASVAGATPSGNGIVFNGVVPGTTPPDVTIASAPGSSPAGYVPLSLFGIDPVSGVTDDTLINFNVPAFTYAGNTYTRLGFASNGYVVVGGGTGADISINNQNFPNPAQPNNTLAAFWTDLNPAAAGALRIGTLTDGSDTWIVMDWAGVREFSLNKKASFEIWIGVNGDAHPGEDITFTYGTIEGNGDGGFLSVGAENFQGNRGQNTYFNGAGTLPSNGTELLVTGTPGSVGSHVIRFDAKGVSKGKWVNYAVMTGDTFFGTNIARFAGEVTP